MTKGLKDGEPNGRDAYPDIIDHQHWQSPDRPHMSLYDRAAQFAPFDALAGYTDMIREEQRETETQIELEAYELEALNQKLSLISDIIEAGKHPTVTITCFVPGAHKAGGEYIDITDSVKRVDTIARKVVLTTTEGKAGINKSIDFDRIIQITGDLVDHMDDGVK